MSSRPVYIPGKKRQRQKQGQQPRFHGAFQGGFSAGYFNTVGSKEGWTPKESSSAAVGRDQSLEDFMDEQDHQDWGGPSRLRTEYGGDAKKHPHQQSAAILPAAKFPPSASAQPILNELFQISHQTVGPRLLRHLGWREGGSSAYVPKEEDGNAANNYNCDAEQTLLSKRKLRKIQLLKERIPLPPPKLDQCGLGFEPYKDAPEFQRHREKRKQQAQARARAPSNVYRASKLAENNNHENATERLHSNSEEANLYESYETMEDFVGAKSVGGFALNDADDDAYDEDHTKTAKAAIANKEEYNLEVYEPSSSDDESMKNNGEAATAGTNNISGDFGGLLSSWASTTTSVNKHQLDETGENSNAKSAGVTSDGKPPLPGFSMGRSFEVNAQRFPGPDVPLSYQVKPHVFSDNEHPLVFQTLSRAVQLEAEETRRETAVKEVLQSNRQTPMAGGRFTALQQAMKNRFTSGGATTKEEAPSTTPVGLHVPSASTTPDNSKASTDNTTTITKPEAIKITRTMEMFSPHPLVCKRFHVSVPQHASSSRAEEKQAKTKESQFFEKQVLSGLKNETTAPHVDAFAPTALEKAHKTQASAVSTLDEPPSAALERPSMDTMKDIFDHSNSEDEDSSDSDNEDDLDQHAVPSTQLVVRNEKKHMDKDSMSQEEDNYLKLQAGLEEESKQMVIYKDEGGKEHRETKKRSRKDKHRKRKKSSRTVDDSDASTREGRKRRKKRSSRSDDRSLSSDDLDRSSVSSDDSNDRRKRKEKKKRDRKHRDKKKKSKRR